MIILSLSDGLFQETVVLIKLICEGEVDGISVFPHNKGWYNFTKFNYFYPVLHKKYLGSD